MRHLSECFGLIDRSRCRLLAFSLFVAFLLPLPRLAALTVTAVTSGNGRPAHEVQWTDSAGLPRSAVMVDQSASGPGYLYSLTYQYNGSPRVCAGTGITGYPGDGFVENHNTQGSDNNSLDDSTPGTTTLLLNGNSHLIIQYSMPTYQIIGTTVPTTICWFFADGRSNPIFAISQDARATTGNLGADTRSPYGSLNFDGTADGESDLGGASYGDTLKFVTLASNPEEVTGLSGWSDNQANTIPYAMEWIDPAEVDAEMGHVAIVPITVQDEGSDRDQNSTLDPRTSKAPNGPMIPYGATLANGSDGPDAWAFQLLDYILHPDYDGDTQGAGDSVQASYAKLSWGSNFGKLGGYNNGNNSLNGTQYSQHYNSGANILTGTRVSGMLLAYSVFEVLGAHNGSYINGAVGQTVVQMQNVTQAAFTATIGTVAATGPAGVGNATNATTTYSPVGFNPTYATWEIAAITNTVNATLTVPTNYPLDYPIFQVDNYTTNQLPASIAVGTGLTNAGANYFASVDANSHRLWITVNRVVTNALNVVVKFSASPSQPAPVIASFSPTSGVVGTAVTITGQNLTNATTVTFDGVSVSAFTIVSATEITTTVPSGATIGPVAVTTPGGTVASTANFTVTTPAPTLSSFTPTNGPVSTSVTITGANLTGATAVSFNGVAAISFTVNSATQITATVPTGATTGEISLTTPGGTVHSTTSFTVTTPAPTLSSFNPASGPVGTSVTITGANLTGATAVSFNGVIATTFTVNSATQITASVPTGTTTGEISLTTPGGSAHSTTSFTVTVAVPAISSFSPPGGPVGTSVVITGSNLTGATAVAFNGVAAASFTVNSATQITATVPTGATTGEISLTTPGGTVHSTTSFVIQSSANLPIYIDGLLNGFADYSWATNVNDYNPSPVYSGAYSISVTGSAYTALSLYHADFSTAPYASMSFWINGGAAGASGLQVMGVTNLSTTLSYASIYNLPALAPNTWTQFNLPLSALGVANITNCQGFWFWPTLNGATTFYVDSVQLNVATPPALSLRPLAKPSGSLVVQLSGLTGQSYWLQTSTNLLNWTSVSTNTLISASLNITNAVNPALNRQYWRAVLP